MLTPAQILAGFAFPAILIAVGALLAWRTWNRAAHCDGRWIFAPLIGAGFAVAFWQFEFRPAWPPGSGNVLNWLFYFAIVIGLIGWLDAWLRPPLWMRAVVVLILWRMAVRLLLMPQMPAQMSFAAGELAIDATSLIALGWWLAIETLADRVPGPTVPLVLALLSCGAAVVMGAAWHIQASGELAGTLAVICFAIVPVAAWRRHISISRGGTAAIVLLLHILLVHAYFYTSDVLTASQDGYIAIFLACPLLAFAGDLPRLRQARRGWRLAARLIPIALIVGGVAALSLRDYLRAEAAQTAEQDD